MKRIVLFASGSGTNAENIVHFFKASSVVEVSSIMCNVPKAGVLQRANILSINAMVFDRTMFYESDVVLDYLLKQNPDLIVLAGFLWLIPRNIISSFPGRIINIHPALLPKYGGKGMYGDRVHKAVIAGGDAESGITIHFVSESYDEGDIIFQARCPVSADDTPESLAAKVHQLEYRHFPRVIEQVLRNQL